MKIKINNKIFFFFNKFSVKLNLDTVASSFSFVAKFNPENEDHKILFKPLSYPKIEIFKDDDTLLLTGYIINHIFNSNENPELVKLSGYSLGGVLEDCSIPYSEYPLESINRSLKDISEKLLNKFNLKLIIDENASKDANLIYKKTSASPSQSIKQYLSKLAAQRNIVISHNEKGDIIYFKPNILAYPKILLNKLNSIKMTLNVAGQRLHNEITVIRQSSTEYNNLTPVDTVKNPLINEFRPKVKILSSGTITDTKKAAENAIASENENIQLSIKIPIWEDLYPGDVIEVENDEIYLYKRTKFIIKSLTMNESNDSRTMDILAVLPETYTSGKTSKIFD